MTNMELLGVVQGERVSIRKRHVWKLLGVEQLPWTGGAEEIRTRTGWKRSILKKIAKKNRIGFTKAVAGGRQPRVGTK